MSNVTLSIGNKLRVARTIKGFSQEYVAKKLGISQQQYRRLENKDENSITWERLEKISNILETDLELILNLNKNPIINSSIKDCHQVGNVNASYQNTDFEKEREIYQKHQSDLKDEMLFYRQLFEKLSPKNNSTAL